MIEQYDFIKRKICIKNKKILNFEILKVQCQCDKVFDNIK